ncbi:hypothetical protein MIND_00267600 [Mycena indigotica]|uniref:Uncharacterized protein n=1 Tax=Mycena indigotica TaxID=2126181 RepID=A0A8H6T9R2_9AGAR|nr:uncharacterized protein MIND_00267600 [Mycena indigotica]KAF7312537.1 hypothetical protein MIND_00267600 [Mycena indigotica]
MLGCTEDCTTFLESTLSSAQYYSPKTPTDPYMTAPTSPSAKNPLNLEARHENSIGRDEEIRVPPSPLNTTEDHHIVHLLVVIDEFPHSTQPESTRSGEPAPLTVSDDVNPQIMNPRRFFFAYVRGQTLPPDCSLVKSQDIIALATDWGTKDDEAVVTPEVLYQLVAANHRLNCRGICVALLDSSKTMYSAMLYSPRRLDDASMISRGLDGSRLLSRTSNEISLWDPIFLEPQLLDRTKDGENIVHLLIDLPPPAVQPLKRPAEHQYQSTTSVGERTAKRRRSKSVEGVEDGMAGERCSSVQAHHKEFMAKGDASLLDTVFNDLTSAAQDLRAAAFNEFDGSTRAYIDHPACAEVASYVVSAITVVSDPSIGDETAWNADFGYSNTKRPETMFTLLLDIDEVGRLGSGYPLNVMASFWLAYKLQTGEQYEITANMAAEFLDSILTTMDKNGHTLFFAVILHPAAFQGRAHVFELGERRYHDLAQVLERHQKHVVLSVAPFPAANFLAYEGVFAHRPTNLLYHPKIMRHWGFDQNQVNILLKEYAQGATAEIQRKARETLEQRCRVTYGVDDTTSTRTRPSFYPYGRVIEVLQALETGLEPTIQQTLADLKCFPTINKWQWDSVSVIAHAAERDDRALLATLLYHNNEVLPNNKFTSLPFLAFDANAGQIVKSCLFFLPSDPVPIIPPLLLFRFMRAMGIIDLFFSESSRKVVIRFVNTHMQQEARNSVVFKYDRDGYMHSIHDIENGAKQGVTVASWVKACLQRHLATLDITEIVEFYERSIQQTVMKDIVGYDPKVAPPGFVAPIQEVRFWYSSDPPEHVEPWRIDGLSFPDTRFISFSHERASYTLHLFEFKIARLRQLYEGTYGIEVFKGKKDTEINQILKEFDTFLLNNETHIVKWVNDTLQYARSLAGKRLRDKIKEMDHTEWDGKSNVKPGQQLKFSDLHIHYRVEEKSNARFRRSVESLIYRLAEQCWEYPRAMSKGTNGSKDRLERRDVETGQKGHEIRAIAVFSLGSVVITRGFNPVQTEYTFHSVAPVFPE